MHPSSFAPGGLNKVTDLVLPQKAKFRQCFVGDFHFKILWFWISCSFWGSVWRLARSGCSDLADLHPPPPDAGLVTLPIEGFVRSHKVDFSHKKRYILEGTIWFSYSHLGYCCSISSNTIPAMALQHCTGLHDFLQFQVRFTIGTIWLLHDPWSSSDLKKRRTIHIW